jgi:hypothetical protein
MKIYLTNSLCKKCPYSAFRQCHYKRSFYEKVPKATNNFKLVHRCKYYWKIFKKGQPVLIDLHHQVRIHDNKWEYIVAHTDVPGIIKGTRGNKYIIELLEAFLLLRKKKGNPQTSRVQLFLECTRAAKDIRPLILSKQTIKNTQCNSKTLFLRDFQHN